LTPTVLLVITKLKFYCDSDPLRPDSFDLSTSFLSFFLLSFPTPLENLIMPTPHASVFTRRESNVRSYCRSFPVVFTQARGAILKDASGREYIDLLCGAGSVNYGHNPPAIKREIMEYLERDGLIHGLDLHSDAKADFLETFERHILAPRKLDYRVQFTGPTGTNAVEAAFKVARLATGRKTVVAFTHGYHGLTMGALSATANSFFRDAAGGTLGDTAFMPYCGWLGDEVDTIAIFRKYLEDPSSGLDKPAAVVVETVQGEGGINIASIQWLKDLSELCKEQDIVLIIDDIQAGCGRTGTFFSFERAGIKPDIVTLSKSIGGYGLPMALTLIRPDLDVWEPAQHTGTFRGNNLAFVAAAAAIRNFWADRVLERKVRDRARQIERCVEHVIAAHPNTEFTHRGIGLMQGLICGEPTLAKEISRQAFTRGLIIECAGADDEVVKLMPCLTIGEGTLARALDIFTAAVDAAITTHKVEVNAEEEVVA
jgi:diaminobutyrate-2-oxoglutarate transaminase